jgi:hypothetical protein
MTPLFKKLNFKDQPTIIAINSPTSFDGELAQMQSKATIFRNLKDASETEFAICFVTIQNEIDDFIVEIFPKLKGDAVLWICYPKGTSKKYKCDFNQDTGWKSLGTLNLEPVRQVAVDEDWSALRFRKVEFIKTITRRESYALTSEAKERTTQKGK